MTSRIHINAPTGVIEVEGAEEFVEAQLDKLLPLIEACGFGTRPIPAAPAPAGTNGTADEELPSDPAEDDAQTKNQAAAKKSRRGKVRAPKRSVMR